MPDLNDQLRRYIDGLEEPVSVEESMSRHGTRRFRVPAAVLAGAAIVAIPALVLIGLRWLPAGNEVSGSTLPPGTTTTPPTTSAAPESTTTPPATTTSEPVTATTFAEPTEIPPTAVEVSAHIASFGGDNLIDGDLSTAWQATYDDNLIITFRWDHPVQIDHIEIYNITDEVRFLRNYRIKGYKISVDDLPGVVLRDTLEDKIGGPQRIDAGSIGTTEFTLEITSTYQSSPVEEAPPYLEVAVAEFAFFGHPVEE